MAYDRLHYAILAALRERERETIERCAQVCKEKAEQSHSDGYEDQRDTEWRCAHDIRALLPPEEKTTPCE